MGIPLGAWEKTKSFEDEGLGLWPFGDKCSKGMILTLIYICIYI